MPTPTNNPNDTHRTHTGSMTGTGETMRNTGTWEDEENWWRENFTSRPYVNRDRGFDYYRPGYRFGFESAQRYGTRTWNDAENDLRTDWDRWQHRGTSKWEEMKDSIRDAWDHFTGKDTGTRRWSSK
jgi:hypothetical protein